MASPDLYEELRPAGVLDRLPDARLGERGRGRGAGGDAPPAPRPRVGRDDRLAQGLSVDGRHPARDRRAALGPGSARGLRGRVAARADPDARGCGQRGRSGRRGRDGRLAFALVPGGAREPHARAAGGVPAPRGVRLRLRRGRRGPGQESEPATRQLVSRARRASSRSGARASRRRASSASGSSQQLHGRCPQDGDLAGLEALLADDVELHGDGGGKAPALARALTRAQPGSRRRSRNWMSGRMPKFDVAEMEPAEVNGQPGAWCSGSDDGSIASVLSLEVARRAHPAGERGRQPGEAHTPLSPRPVGSPADGRSELRLRDRRRRARPAAPSPPV